MGYFAELDDNSIVLRVIVADDLGWCVTNLGGTWVETADPYAEEPQEIAYAGPGQGHSDNLPEAFAPPWDEEAATIPDSQGNYAYETVGQVVFHNGSLWRNITEGTPNVWEPGVSGWHDAPEGGTPTWIQPTGAHDDYALGDVVTHKGQTWQSTVDNNVWEPGVFGWTAV